MTRHRTADFGTGKICSIGSEVLKNFAPWVNHIYFVTWGHIPSWLNTDHPKLTVVKHEDYIPKQYLPTFSSHPIELNMHRIRGLSEQFVYFNDDTFIINKMEPEDFFRNGLPRDYCIEQRWYRMISIIRLPAFL